MTQGKPSGVAAAQTMATDIGRALRGEQPAAWAAFADDSSESGVTALNREAVEEVAAKFGWSVAPLYRKPMLEQDEQEALAALACYLDTRGNITLQAWGSLVRVLLARFT